MRIVHDATAMSGAFAAAGREAEAAFGDRSIYLEKFLLRPRHIEFQILADESGNVVHLGERECSIQRRHQKLIEEAPSTVLTPAERVETGPPPANSRAAPRNAESPPSVTTKGGTLRRVIAVPWSRPRF